MELVIPSFVTVYHNLHEGRTIDALRYDLRGRALIYGILCHPENMIYVGSTWDSVRRFRQHLITGHSSNPHLQVDISKHGLSSISLYIFKYVSTKGLTAVERKALITSVEQSYINSFPTEVLYNSMNSKVVA